MADAAGQPGLAQRLAAELAAGRCWATPTETVYTALAASPRRDRASAWVLHAPDMAAAAKAGRLDDPRIARLVQRFWPGPLSIEVPRADRDDREQSPTITLRVPAAAFVRAVLAASPTPVFGVELTGPSPGSWADEAELAAGSAAVHADGVVDGGPCPLGAPSTIVRCTGAELETLREGILSEQEILHAAASQVLFVCTGNTCRSPLAEALARRAVCHALGIDDGALLRRGLAFGSAGTSTLAGMPASRGSTLVAAELGLDLDGHQSRPFTRGLGARQDRIYCLSQSHLEAVLEQAPDLEMRAQLLRPDGGDIQDPYGGDEHVYRRARQEIEEAALQRTEEWLALLPQAARGAV